MNPRLRRSRKLMTSEQATPLMLRETVPPHLRQSPSLSHRSHLRVTDSQTSTFLDVQVLFVNRVLAFIMLSTIPVLTTSMFYYFSMGNDQVMTVKNNAYNRFPHILWIGFHRAKYNLNLHELSSR